jgi:hypothetical protein
MDPTQIIEVSSNYKNLLQSIGAHPKKCDTSLNTNSGDPCIYDHCLWMCQVIDGFVSSGESEKALRWVCFIQGVLWSTGLLNIDSMREDNRKVIGKSI